MTLPRSAQRFAPAFAAVLCASLWGSITTAQGVTVGDTVESEATVQSVNMETRQIVLKSAESGSNFVVVAGPEVRNLDQLEAGDVIRAAYSIGVAARLAPEGAEGTTAAVATAVAEEGSKPGAVVGSELTTVFTILAYDAVAHVATVEGEDGSSRLLAVREPEMQSYAQTLKPGDRVEVTFTEAIAIGVVEQ
jgi:hypothetical protein